MGGTMRYLFELFLLFILGIGVVAAYRAFFGSSPKNDELPKFKNEDEI